MKKIFIFTIIISLLVPNIIFAENTPEITIEPTSAILINATTGEILFEKNADEQLPIASLTKMMTMTIINEELKKGNIKYHDNVTISEKAWKTGGTRMFLAHNNKVSVEELFKGIAVVSGNDASVAMAEHISGDVDSFVNKMNEKAKALQMYNTDFVSPHGVPNQDKMDISTVRDLGILANYYIEKFPEKLEIHRMNSYTTSKEISNGKDDIPQPNQNPLVNSYRGATGLKTGWIDNLSNIIGTAERDGISLVVVILGAKNNSERSYSAQKLLDYGFSLYKAVNKGNKGEIIANLKVYRSDTTNKSSVALSDDLNLVILKSEEENIEITDDIPTYLTGGIKNGEKVGERIITIGDKTYKTDVIATETLDEAGFVKSFFDSLALLFNWVIDSIL